MIDFNHVADESRASIEKADLKVLLPLVAAIDPKIILEVGMHQGYSMEVWRKAFNPGVLVGIEMSPPTPESYIDEVGMLWNTDSHNSDTINKASLILDEQYDFLFIDGDHSLEGVTRDFEMYSPLVRKGGIIVFHDVVYTSPDPLNPVMVKPLWDEVKTKHPYVEIKVGERSTGIGMIWL